MPIEINHRLSIPDDALEERFLAATGPGGQNVIKVATAVQMRCDTRLIDLPPFARDRLRRIEGRRMTAEGFVLISANRFRTQEANREAARSRLAEMVAESLVRDAPRRPTRPTKASQRRRGAGMPARGAIKRGRGRPSSDSQRSEERRVGKECVSPCT